MAVCSLFFAGCSQQPSEPESEAAAEESIEEQQGMMEEEMQGAPGSGDESAAP
jgi:hypothetical protein